MPRWTARDTSDYSDEEYQDYILEAVSRTFALTIPQLPAVLQRSVGNAYLLCRIADTIEDDPDLDAAGKTRFSEQFIAVVVGERPVEPFVREMLAALSPRAEDGERDLIRNLARVIRITHGLSPVTQRAMRRAVKIMATGMARFQRHPDRRGLKDLAELDSYCYHVAGVVGEMLTEIYAECVPEIARQRQHMLELAVSFGQGLQMTNILKDVGTDRARGVSWLPRSVLRQHGIQPDELTGMVPDARFGAVIDELTGIAHAHLHNALRYTLLIPARERGLRRFCLWALGMAILTLRKVHQQRQTRQSGTVKISRSAVRSVIVLTAITGGQDRLLTGLFRRVTRGLPLAGPPVSICREPLTDVQDAVAYRLTG